tara:strand:+ start:44 stop:244 length:201 start_codon:yes stop_codon:yes gene_type:complete
MLRILELNKEVAIDREFIKGMRAELKLDHPKELKAILTRHMIASIQSIKDMKAEINAIENLRRSKL